MKSILGNTRKPDVIFHASGRINITSGVASRLRLSAGDVIDILTDGEEYYLYVKHRSPVVVGKHEGAVYYSNKHGKHCRASSVRLCREILKICNADGIARLSAGETITDEEGRELIPIITKHLL